MNFICTLVGVAHRWRVLSISGLSASVFTDARIASLGSYVVQTISTNGYMVTESRLSVISSQELRGEMFTCDVPGEGGEAQETTARVFGKIVWR